MSNNLTLADAIVASANTGQMPAELTLLDSLTGTAAEINVLAGVTPGTATASKAVVLGASKEIATITSATITTLTAPNVSGATAFAAAITPTGGVAAAGGFTARPSNVHTGGIPAQVNTDGTDTTPSVSETYYAAVFIPCNMTVTGVSVFLGSATEGNMKVGLFNSAGALLATSASTDVSAATVDSYLRIPFTATYGAVGPATYYVGILNDNTANRFNSHTFGDFPAGKTTGETYATGFTTIASPATTFTTALGPIASLY